jgi:hypothetical protein
MPVVKMVPFRTTVPPSALTPRRQIACHRLKANARQIALRRHLQMRMAAPLVAVQGLVVLVVLQPSFTGLMYQTRSSSAVQQQANSPLKK